MAVETNEAATVEELEPVNAESFMETVSSGRKEILKTKIESDVRLNVFVIGVGNAGNQTICQGHKDGMNVYAINSSVRDMSDTIMSEGIPCFIIGKEARGSGKNIEKGKALFKENGKDLFHNKEFITSCQDADVIVVTSATGGGTGPSASPEICRILQKMFDKKIIIYHGITPKNSDSNIAFSNTIYCLNEIKELKIPYMLTDLEAFANEANDVAFVKADKHAIQCIKLISGLYLKMSDSQMIDENDLKSLISEPGYMAAYLVDDITSYKLERKTAQSMMVEEIKHGPAVMIQKDGISIHAGVITDFPDDIAEVTRTGNYDELFSFIGHKPKNGVYENTSVTNGTAGMFGLILSGMTYPINRLSYYIDKVKEQNEFLKKSKDIDVSHDAKLMQQMVQNNSDKLASNSKADEAKIESVLDEFF